MACTYSQLKLVAKFSQLSSFTLSNRVALLSRVWFITLVAITGMLLVGCPTKPDDVPVECAKCTYASNPYGNRFSPAGGDRLLRTIPEVNGYIYADYSDRMWFKTLDGSRAVDISQLVMEKYHLRTVFLSCGVYDHQRMSLWLGVYWRGTDVTPSGNDSTAVIEMNLETSSIQEHPINHIWTNNFDNTHQTLVTIRDAYHYNNECRLVTNTFDQLVLRDGALVQVNDDEFNMMKVNGRIISSCTTESSVLWSFVLAESETFMLDDKVVVVPSLAGFRSVIDDYDEATRTFLVHTRIDSCAYRVSASDFTLRSSRIDVCTIDSETADTIRLRPVRSLDLSALDCTIVVSSQHSRIYADTSTVMFTGYRWGDPYHRLFKSSGHILSAL